MSTRQGEGRAEAPVAIGRYRTPWGMGNVFVSEGFLVGVDLPVVDGGPPLTDTATCAEDVSPLDLAALRRWVDYLEAYFHGERMVWSADEVPLREVVSGPFQRAVYAALLLVPPGETVSYGMLAEMAGYPRAARAVGNAMAENPIPVVIPCHRVIRSDGSLGRYGKDSSWKERLLAHERAWAVRETQ